MSSYARRTGVIVGVVCAVAAALPCLAADAAGSGASGQPSQHAPAEENIGFFSGVAIGAVAGGPFGAVAGGVAGALLGAHYHKQKLANHELAASLSGSNADNARLTHTVMQLGSSLDRASDLTLSIGFRTADARLSEQDIGQLTRLGALASGIEGVKLQVSGYADPRGAAQYNVDLSQQRAEAVATVLVHAGVDKDRILINALGADGASASGSLDDYALERRVTVKLVASGSGDSKTAGTVAQVQ